MIANLFSGRGRRTGTGATPAYLHRWSSVFVASGIVLLVAFGCTKKMQRYKQAFFRMNTLTEVTVVLPAQRAPGTIWRSVDSLLLDWEERFSVTGERSEVQAINNRSGAVVPVNRQLAEMVAYSLHYGDSLDGGFDLTILPVKEVWGFGEQAGDDMPLPTATQVDSALSLVSYRQVRLNDTGDSLHFAQPGVRIDVGGVAKGFVLRELIRLFDAFGIESYLVVAGGDVAGKGKKPDGKPWLVGIQDPRTPDALIGTLPLDSGAVVTSGDYERFRIVNGVRHHHLFSSTTGRPCSINRSVTVRGVSPVEVDILSTGLFCRTAKEIIAYIDARPSFQCMVVDSSGIIHISRNWGGN